MRLRRKAKPKGKNLGTYVRAPAWPEPTIEEYVDDAKLVADAAVRMSLKNLLVMRALQERLDYSADAMLEAVRLEITHLALEKEADSARVQNDLQIASTRTGQAVHLADYHRADVAALTKRREILDQLAAELRIQADDDAHLVEVIDSAKRAALEEIVAARIGTPAEPRLNRDTSPDEWVTQHELLVADLQLLKADAAD